MRRKGQLIELSVPHVVQRYNASMGGVDRLDQLRSYFPIGRSGRRWWKFLFWGILNIAVVNAYVLWMASNRPLPANRRLYGLKFFKAELVHNLCDNTIATRNRRVAPPMQQPEALYTVEENAVAGHSLVRLDGRKRVCQSCRRLGRKTTSGRSVETCFGCLTCNVHLCKEGTCFMDHHA